MDDELNSGANVGEASSGDFDLDSAVEELGDSLGLGGDDEGEASREEGESASAAVARPPEEKAEQAAPAAEKPAKRNLSLTREDGTPRTWKPEAAAAWAQIPEVAKQEILRREADIFNGLEAQRPMANFGKVMAEVISPYEQILRQHNINPAAQVQSLMQSHYTLAFGTAEQKSALLQTLIRDYGIDISGFQAFTDDSQYIDPQVKTLQQTIGDLKSELQSLKTGLQSERAAEVQASIHSEIEKFSKSPDVPYFPLVHKQMGDLLRAGVAQDLQEAYNKAIWLVPEVAEKLIAERAAKEQERLQTEAQQRVRKVQNLTAGSVRSEGRTGSATAALGSIEDTMQETLSAIRGRG